MNIEQRATEFVKNNFVDISESQKKILERFLVNTDIELPQIGIPSCYYKGLVLTKTMASNETYMTGFANLRKLFLKEECRVYVFGEYDYDLFLGTHKECENYINELENDDVSDESNYQKISYRIERLTIKNKR
ncbi:hypothetical protein [Poseidonibacter ostreae]|uniref:Uncharacterized protein n=1 Tax=Poseidonibacter ostreae TaxID=2654171 RepID=A0A6L4WWJ5_9BACT|nr:hypothetical protein [Poseidonibacter ostreae]KAB7891422.1 hypothetical protein GBG19_00875 [Poseidonibacter ostreae]